MPTYTAESERPLVYDNGTLTGACYDIITVGVFTAYALKYKQGGLRRLMQQLNQRQTSPAADTAAPLLAVGGSTFPWSRLASVTQMLSRLSKLQSATLEACDSLCAVAAAGDPSALQAAATLLTEQVTLPLRTSSCSQHTCLKTDLD